MKINEYIVSVTKEGAIVGCTFVSLAQVKTVLKMIQESKISLPKKGQLVKVIKGIDDAKRVLGKTGTVISTKPGEILVRFPDFTNGHGKGLHEWYINPCSVSFVSAKKKAVKK